MANATELLQVGQDAYRDRSYEAAIEGFNKALDASVSQSAIRIQALDNLVAVYVKLERLGDAFTNAKSMIRSDRTDARGYLRCGQIQRLQDDHKAACKWYEHGLRNVKAESRLRPTLASSLEKSKEHASQHRMQSKRCDPTTSLPLEVVRMIASHLDYKEHVKMLRVSKHWRKLISSLPPTNDTLDFSGARRTISYNMLRAAVRRLTVYPKTMQLAMLSGPAIKYLNDRLELWCRKPTMQHVGINDRRIDLQRICWQSLPLQTLTLGMEASLHDSALENILLQCNSLKILVMESPSTYSGHVLEFPPSFSQSQLKKLVLSTNIQLKSLSCFPNLVHLEYHRTSCLQITEELDLTFNHQLRYVEISTTGIFTGVFTRLPKEIEVMKAWTGGGFTIDVSSSLRHLELRCDPHLLDQYNRLLKCGAFDGVRTFAAEFSHCQPFNQAGVDFLFNHCSNFEHMSFRSPLLVDSDYGKIVGTTPKLRSLIIESAQITGAFLADLFKADTCQIESISLRGCSKVSSDTWDWIRQRGVLLDVRNCGEGHITNGARRVVDLR